MTLEAILSLVLQTAVLLVAILGILIPYLADQKKKQADALAKALGEFADQLAKLEMRHQREIDALKAALVQERDDRVTKTARLHERIDELLERVIGKILSDLSDISGQLKGVSNILLPIQQWFINQANKSQNGG